MATIPAVADVSYLPARTADAQLRATSVEALFDAAVQLTHMIHGTDDVETRIGLREQRLMIRTEILRRLQGAA